MTAAAPTPEGYQEDRACRNCDGKGTWVRMVGARAFVVRGTVLGTSECGNLLYVWTKCRSCGGSGLQGSTDEQEALAWCIRVGFRPAASEPGYAVRGMVRRPGGIVEGDTAAGELQAR